MSARTTSSDSASSLPQPLTEKELDAIEKRLWFDESGNGDFQVVINEVRRLRVRETALEERLRASEQETTRITAALEELISAIERWNYLPQLAGRVEDATEAARGVLNDN